MKQKKVIYCFSGISQKKERMYYGKKKTGAIPVNAPKKEKKMVIDMTKAELKKSYINPGFRTGRHMTEKDRPRKKNWKKEYYPESCSFFIYDPLLFRTEY